MGGSLALNQILVSMDGLGSPPFTKRFLSNRINNLLDALYIVPRRIGRVSLRVRKPKPANEQIYFIGACNVPIEALDPALTRPGRMGRHVWFRTPTKQDRIDIFDLYLGKVSHEADLDSPKRRDELARITNGYSPAMIEQVTSMALTLAHNDNRMKFGWTDIVDALTTVESGTAVGIEYVPEETRAVAIHEAGHAACARSCASRARRHSVRARSYAAVASSCSAALASARPMIRSHRLTAIAAGGAGSGTSNGSGVCDSDHSGDGVCRWIALSSSKPASISCSR